jgi:hypothetical protein
LKLNILNKMSLTTIIVWRKHKDVCVYVKMGKEVEGSDKKTSVADLEGKPPSPL